MAELTVLADGTIRYSDGTKPYVELTRAQWASSTASTVRTQIMNWLTANKLTGWTVTVTSTGNPPVMTVSTNSTKMA